MFNKIIGVYNCWQKHWATPAPLTRNRYCVYHALTRTFCSFLEECKKSEPERDRTTFLSCAFHFLEVAMTESPAFCCANWWGRERRCCDYWDPDLLDLHIDFLDSTLFLWLRMTRELLLMAPDNGDNKKGSVIRESFQCPAGICFSMFAVMVRRNSSISQWRFLSFKFQFQTFIFRFKHLRLNSVMLLKKKYNCCILACQTNVS